MRLFLLPISTRRTLIYCQRLNITTSEKQTVLEKVTQRAANLWASWEKKESGWQKKVVDLGNKALKRIPYEEWGLKSIPPLSARRRESETSRKEKVEILYPPALIPKIQVLEVLKILGTERESLHRSRMVYSFIGMPLSIPFALVPVIPNLPFFYLVFRAWSHWRALSGSKHIQFLIDQKLVQTQPSPILDTLYSAGIMRAVRDNSVTQNKKAKNLQAENAHSTSSTENEALVLDKWNGKLIAKALQIPELEVELDRAIWQVDIALKGKEELIEEKEELDKATTRSDPQGERSEKK